MASNAHIHQPDDHHSDRYCLGDPTEGAIITFASKAGYNPTQFNQQYPELCEFPFDSTRKMMSSIRCIDGIYYLWVKGAVDQILQKSSQMMTTQGVQKLTSEDSQTIIQKVD